jgi:short-subunit dehydrogenase
VSFPSRYGPWAVVAGASEGLGAAFAEALAGRGLNVVAVARREEPLEALARRVESAYEVDVRVVRADLADPGFPDVLAAATRDIEVGVGVYNAAFSFLAPLLDRPPEDALRVVDVNVRGPLLFVHGLAPAMVARGRGALVLMSSLAGNQGSPGLSAYAASKAFTTTLAEGLWGELAPAGVDVLACVAGAVRTPGYAGALRRDAPGTLDPAVVAEAALRALGRGPVVTPGATNRLASFAMRRLVPRRAAVRIMRRSLERLGDG